MVHQFHFQILILSGSLSLQRRLEAFPVPEGVTAVLTTEQGPANGALPAADIVLLDGRAVMPRISGKKRECIAIVGPQELEDPELLLQLQEGVLSGLWVGPLSDRLLQHYYRKLLESAKEKKRSEMTQVFLDTMVNSVPDLIWFKDLRGAHMKVNDAFGKAVGKTKEQCEGRGHYYIWDLEPEEYANGEYVCLETEEEVIRRGETCLFDEKVMSKNGLRQFKTYKSPLYDGRGKMFGTVGIAKDVTDLQNLSRELEVILSSIPFAAMVADEKGTVVYVNKLFSQYFNISGDALKALPYSEVCRSCLESSVDRLHEEKLFEISFRHPEGLKHFRVQQQSLHDIFQNHFGYFLICLDVTNEHQLQQDILDNANTDFLTGLYNRRYFYDTVYQKEKDTVAVFIYLDIDNFKLVNDKHGHQTGDEALKLMASLLEACFKGDLVVRMGGDEFIVAKFGRLDIPAAEEQVKAFLARAAEAFLKNPLYEEISVSAGIAGSYGREFQADQLIFEADSALYRAKTTGKNRYCVHLY